MKTRAMSLLLAATFVASTMPRISFAQTQERSMEQIIQQKQLERQQASANLEKLKLSLVDVQLQLESEEKTVKGRLLTTTKLVRNVGLVVTAAGAVASYYSYYHVGDSAFWGSAFVTIVAGAVSGLAEVGVALTNDQVDELNSRIEAIKNEITQEQQRLARLK